VLFPTATIEHKGGNGGGSFLRLKASPHILLIDCRCQYDDYVIKLPIALVLSSLLKLLS
jgi:hypothetical protein